MQITKAKIKQFLLDWDYAKYVITTNLQRKFNGIRYRYWGIAPPPKMLIIQLTGVCNLHCRMCDQWGEKGLFKPVPKNKLVLPLATIENIFDQMEKYKPKLELLGGEPTLHPDFDKILASIKQRGLTASLETNGTILNKKAEQIVNSSIEAINLSIDGPEQIHDKIRGKVGTFALAMNGMEKILQLRKGKKSEKPFINIRMTVCEENFEHIIETVEMFKDKPILSFTIQHLMYPHPKINQANYALLRQIKPDHLEVMIEDDKQPQIDSQVLWEQIESVCKKRTYPFYVGTKPQYKKEYVDIYYEDMSKLPDPGLICNMPREVIVVDCLGNVTICSRFIVGNIKEGTLAEHWNGIYSRKFRKLLQKRTTIPACKVCCYPSDD